MRGSDAPRLQLRAPVRGDVSRPEWDDMECSPLSHLRPAGKHERNTAQNPPRRDGGLSLCTPALSRVLARLSAGLCVLALGSGGAGCAGANHLGHPLTLPLSGISSALHNASYAARRRPVAAFVAQNHGALVRDITRSGGPTLQSAMDLARIAPARRAALTHRLGQDLTLYQQDAEALVVALMVHGP